jgi:hypothetical protein
VKALLLRMKTYWAMQNYENALRDAEVALALLDGKHHLAKSDKSMKLKRQIWEL